MRQPFSKQQHKLFAGLGSVHIVKSRDRGLENAASGRKPRARGHSFSLYGPTLSRQITYVIFFFLPDKIGLRVGLRNFVVELTGVIRGAYKPS